MYFDHYISLGRNCEVAFQFRRVLGKDYSGFFSWNITEFNALISILENDFVDLMQPGALSYENKGSLVRDAAYDYHFHWTDDNFSLIDNENAVLAAHRQKARYLAEKFREQVKSPAQKALFYLTEESNARGRAQQVRRLLRDKFSAKKNAPLSLCSRLMCPSPIGAKRELPIDMSPGLLRGQMRSMAM
ncbi:MAG: DUF1796 family putative cysteine peptidase [Methylovirgula sp.]